EKVFFNSNFDGIVYYYTLESGLDRIGKCYARAGFENGYYCIVVYGVPVASFKNNWIEKIFLYYPIGEYKDYELEIQINF
ncbi:MAG: hypothetical protein Q4Q06_01560, partial [Bacteroidota bacterium]|nr:hypothetical protein [Bacteroidota bacterium]